MENKKFIMISVGAGLVFCLVLGLGLGLGHLNANKGTDDSTSGQLKDSSPAPPDGD